MIGATVIAACLSCTQAVAEAKSASVDVELVLAVDVSRSMDEEEFRLQRAGYVAALRHPDFIAAIASGHHRRIALTYFEWAETVRPDSIVTWRVIDSAESAERFASELEARPFGGLRGTSISGAVDFGTGLFPQNHVTGERQVIDVSGDGPNNIGRPVAEARDDAVDRGITINGLPILVRPSPTFKHLDRYYAECVIGGPGSFMLPIYDPSEFATAIRRKLILEVSGAPVENQVVPVIATEPVDCLKGERDRRLFADPYFPELDR